ncbi:MAG: 1-acyl-sn-glycerol-3-phosphate acyltransferase, partial [Myxococcota bacterium]
MGTLVYHLLRAFLWLVTRVFFRTVEVSGLEHIPPRGAVIFCGNHPNSLLDPVLITTSCPRRVRFAAKDTLFESRFLRPFLLALGAVPVRRRQDHMDATVLNNERAFEVLHEVLRGEGAFGIFPEGISHSLPALAPLKTGAARIALAAAASGIEVHLVPCGLSYHHRTKLRGRVLVHFGAPLLIDKGRLEVFRSDPHAAARALTRDLDGALRAVTINAPDFETMRVLDGVRSLYRPPGHALTLVEQAEISRRFLDHYARLAQRDDVAELYRQIDAYLRRLDTFGLRDEEVGRPLQRRVWLRKMLAQLFLLTVLLPLALPGVLLHVPILLLAVVAGDKLTRREDVIATTKVGVATLLTLTAHGLAGLVAFALLKGPLGYVVPPLLVVGLSASGYAT